MKLTIEEQSTLNRLLAKATSAGPDYAQDYTDVLLSIGKGMFWSKELDMAARDLASKANAAIYPYRGWIELIRQARILNQK
jgi:hypothetical protein